MRKRRPGSKTSSQKPKIVNILHPHPSKTSTPNPTPHLPPTPKPPPEPQAKHHSPKNPLQPPDKLNPYPPTLLKLPQTASLAKQAVRILNIAASKRTANPKPETRWLKRCLSLRLR
ncbi:hypothetical protein IAQ61_009897 [Plenodomus lingam]|uniref:uncharacterized protein n=1 Tax=Leptosphaeria maculans TaxID=5022 RepID=UPI00332B3010|nr:hypothetical protein IAQ61_009897 [Plenodomus lingam]